MKRNLLIVLGAVVIAGTIFAVCKGQSRTRITYLEVKVRRGDISVSILATGTVQPENRLGIKPPIAGRVENVLVKEGLKVRKGQVLVWMSSTERAALLDAARSKGVEEFKRWEELYRPTPVLAPISGTIILRNVESGQTFTNNDSILVMSDRLTVKAQVDETDIAQIKLKQTAQIVLDAYPGQKLSAKVDQIAFDAKTVNNVTTYIVDVLPDNTPEFMRSGMTANVTFLAETRQNVLLVPTEAVKAQDGKSVVTVRGGDGKPVEREIVTGITDGKQVEVVSGLTEDSVVLSAQLKVRDSQNRSGTSPFNPMGRPRGTGGGH